MTMEHIEIREYITSILKILNIHDPYIYAHSLRVAELSEILAEAMGMSSQQIRRLRNAALLHDIGKIGVSDRILQKNGALSPEEYAAMQHHSDIGHDILKQLSVFAEFAEIVRYHHERYDGRGYPAGLRGDTIPLESRMLAVADAFDAITSNRAYRQGCSYEEGFLEVSKHNGDQFCPEVVAYFLSVKDVITGRIPEITRKMVSHVTNINDEQFPHSIRELSRYVRERIA
jgi:putative nucleotidyltransferase with HDIG domain